jgi:hypothetical protein
VTGTGGRDAGMAPNGWVVPGADGEKASRFVGGMYAS